MERPTRPVPKRVTIAHGVSPWQETIRALAWLWFVGGHVELRVETFVSFRTQHDQVGKLRLRRIPHFSGIRHIYVGGSKEDGRRLRQKQGHGDALTRLSLEDNRKNEVGNHKDKWPCTPSPSAAQRSRSLANIGPNYFTDLAKSTGPVRLW